MLYLRDNVLLRRPLEPAHIKPRILGHWGTCPGLSFTLTHLNRLIREHDLDLMFVCALDTAPRRCWPMPISTALLGALSRMLAGRGRHDAPVPALFGAARHRTARHNCPARSTRAVSCYSLSHAFGAAFDNPDLIVAAMVGDGEAETGALAASWQSARFLNPARDGAVLPILHLNGYKIANPALLARIPPAELQAFEGMAIAPVSWLATIRPPCTGRWHARWASAWRKSGDPGRARGGGGPARIRWPMIVLRTPKGWTGPRRFDGHAVENSWRSHQVPLADPAGRPQELQALEAWLRAYQPETLFDQEAGWRPGCGRWPRPARAASAPTRMPMAGHCGVRSRCPGRTHTACRSPRPAPPTRRPRRRWRLSAGGDARKSGPLPAVRPRRDRQQPPGGGL